MFLVPSASGIKLLPTDVSVDTPLTSNVLVVVIPVTTTPPAAVRILAVSSK